MKKIKIRYALKSKHTGQIHFKKYYLNQVEKNGLSKLFDIENYEIISNDLFVGKLKNGDEVFYNDLILHGETIRTVEYRNGNTCLVSQDKKDAILLSFSENPKKVGNIFDNPELLK